MLMAGHLVVVGSLNMDLVVRSPRHPLPGETLLGGDFRTFPGGKGANQAVAAARVGGIVNMVGRVGQDEFGGVLLQNLAAAGVNAAHVLRDTQAATGVALITVSDDGQNTIVVAPGANSNVTPADIQAAYPAFEEASACMLQLEIPLPAVQRAIEEAQRRRVLVILNPAPAQPLEPALLRKVDYLVPNRSELTLLTGEAEVEAGARALLASGVRCVIVTLGGEGVQVWEESGSTHIAAHPVKAVDTTAAGDAFVGAFAVALSHGRSPVEAARWGNAAGAVAVTRAGAQPSLPSRAEVEALLARA
jgi:ribokinase